MIHGWLCGCGDAAYVRGAASAPSFMFVMGAKRSQCSLFLWEGQASAEGEGYLLLQYDY